MKRWHENGWLRRYQAGSQEIADMFQIAERDLKDAGERRISNDWRFGIAYNAVLKLCAALLHAEGYRPERTLQHYRTIQAMPLILGSDRKEDAQYLDTCRSKRNIVEYDQVGAVTDADADELIDFAEEFKIDVIIWFQKNHPELLKK